MREFIRHPADIPLIFNVDNKVPYQKNTIEISNNGGILFRSKIYISPTSHIHIKIPILKINNTLSGIVVWCHKKRSHYDIGVSFQSKESEFKIRMVEQVCYIEQYKQKMLKRKHRKLTQEEAAREWINKYAKKFPSLKKTGNTR